MEHKAKLGCRRLILTHMNEDILARLAEVEPEYARDGQRILL
jgi:phosphoribosyl 1,2-cyclic phosphodiesterase